MIQRWKPFRIPKTVEGPKTVEVFQDNAARFIQTFVLGKLPISIEQDLMNHNKEDASPEEMKTFFYTGDNNVTNSPKQPAKIIPTNNTEPGGRSKTSIAPTTRCKTTDQTIRRKLFLLR